MQPPHTPPGRHRDAYAIVTPTCLNATSQNSRTLCISPVASTKSSGSLCCRIRHMPCERGKEAWLGRPDAWTCQSGVAHPAMRTRLRLRRHLDVVVGVAPVAHGIDVAQVQALLLALADHRDRVRDLAGHKRHAWRRRDQGRPRPRGGRRPAGGGGVCMGVHPRTCGMSGMSGMVCACTTDSASLTATRALVVEQNAVAAVHAVRLSVVFGDPKAVQLGHA